MRKKKLGDVQDPVKKKGKNKWNPHRVRSQEKGRCRKKKSPKRALVEGGKKKSKTKTGFGKKQGTQRSRGMPRQKNQGKKKNQKKANLCRGL